LKNEKNGVSSSIQPHGIISEHINFNLVYHFTKVTPSIWILKSLKQTIISKK